MEKTLSKRVALVTGGAIRVGRAITRELADSGAHVAIHHHRSGGEALSLVAELRARGCSAEAFAADLTADGAPEALARSVEARLGPISILVNSAARFDRAPFLDTPAHVLDSTWALNARAPFLLTQAVARGMAQGGGGDVVNILDIGGALVPWQQYSAYCMSKAALSTLTQVLALELAPKVRVNAVAPGTVLPPEGMNEQALAALRARIPLGRFGTPEEVARTVRFLLDGPQFITGQIIAVDGGRVRGGAHPEPLGPAPATRG